MALPQTLRRHRVPGTMQASSPTEVCGIMGFVVHRLVAMFPAFRRAGVHARRTSVNSKMEGLRPGRVRRDEGIPPYGRPGDCGRLGWPKI